MKATVDDLKNAIKAVNNEYFGELSPSSLDLYKISAYEEAQLHDNLGSPGSGQILLGNEVMDLVFADVPFFLRPRVVVESFYESKQVIAALTDAYPGSERCQLHATLRLSLHSSIRELSIFWRWLAVRPWPLPSKGYLPNSASSSRLVAGSSGLDPLTGL